MISIGYDGTDVNVCKFGVIIQLMEKCISRSLQSIFCLLHMNEFPLRHLFFLIDGTTSSPRTIEKALKDCETNPVVKIQCTSGKMQHIDTEDFRSDQLYLYRLVFIYTD